MKTDMINACVIALSLVVAAPALANDAAPNDASLAQQITDRFWPDGTTYRMLTSDHGVMRLGLQEGAAAAEASLIAAYEEDPQRKAKLEKLVAELTPTEAMAIIDPSYAERHDITFSILVRELEPLATALEPELKAKFAASLDSTYSARELEAAHRFFETEEGRAFAAKFMWLDLDGDLSDVFEPLMDAMMQVPPETWSEIEAATAHLERLEEGLDQRLDAYFEEE